MGSRLRSNFSRLLATITTKSLARMTKCRVQFDLIQINEFPLVLGDHPACRDAHSIELSWDRQSCIVLRIDEYESSFLKRSRHRRRLSRYERKRLLMCHGAISEEEPRGRVSKGWAEILNTMDEVEKKTLALARRLEQLSAQPVRE